MHIDLEMDCNIRKNTHFTFKLIIIIIIIIQYIYTKKHF